MSRFFSAMRQTFPSEEPYRVLFLLGLLHAFVGTSMWIFFSLGIIEYPGVRHAHQMLTGFLLSFSTGFLLTAIPRFTGTQSCKPTELGVAIATSVLAFIIPGPVSALLMLCFISFYMVRRFPKKLHSPPPHFIFLPVGIFIGILGSVMSLLGSSSVLPIESIRAGNTLFYYGTLLSFLLGIGAKLISALLGWSALPTEKKGPRQGVEIRFFVPLLQVTLFVLSFVIELTIQETAGRILRAVCASWISIQNWKIYRLPRSKTKHAYWIWISCWTLLVGLWTHALLPDLNVHAAHLIFIGGFGSMTLMIASRVILAHGSHSLEFEKVSRIYAVTSLLVLLAALTRFISPWSTTYVPHLAYSAATWILAVVIWSCCFIPRIFQPSRAS